MVCMGRLALHEVISDGGGVVRPACAPQRDAPIRQIDGCGSASTVAPDVEAAQLANQSEVFL